MDNSHIIVYMAGYVICYDIHLSGMCALKQKLLLYIVFVKQRSKVCEELTQKQWGLHVWSLCPGSAELTSPCIWDPCCRLGGVHWVHMASIANRQPLARRGKVRREEGGGEMTLFHRVWSDSKLQQQSGWAPNRWPAYCNDHMRFTWRNILYDCMFCTIMQSIFMCWSMKIC